MGNPVLIKRRSVQLLISLFILAVFAGAVTMTFYHGRLRPAQPDNNNEALIDIAPGSTAGKIAALLEDKGLIQDDRAFLIYARITGKIDKFKAGQYYLKASLNVPEIIDILEKGRVATLSFTIPEGFLLQEIVGVLVEKGLATEEEFWAAAESHPYNYSFLEGLSGKMRLEGYLFPDTYIIPRGMSVEKILDVMLRRFEQVYNKMPENKTGLSTHEIVTLASIIEWESLVDKDRPLIAGVFLKRLSIGMKLDSCATIQYILGERKQRLLYADLEIKSPYNTYVHSGLPPGPIGAPGEASLHAVFEAEDTAYLYFLAKGDGTGEHVFSKTLTEHNRNKAKYGGV
ncbi:MAG: endolytic transglycosylase MltG [Clostridia bacterium]|jgi:UPF0755 protein|nr:endolytic transglycosylase MltG [Clostridia bacterium]